MAGGDQGFGGNSAVGWQASEGPLSYKGKMQKGPLCEQTPRGGEGPRPERDVSMRSTSREEQESRAWGLRGGQGAGDEVGEV